eukprot:PhM_4_TR2618/c0_g1_i1/m.16766/K14843/PES1, NOP7; pescadillo
MGRIITKAMSKKRYKKRYLTRSQAKRLLQVDNKEFKRLCILKGIYPRQPTTFKNSGGKDKLYFMTKDIRYLARDPIVDKIREYDTHEKKVRTLKATGKESEAEKLEKSRPQYRLDVTIRERYPSFTDALRDLSDGLSMVHLYAILPPQLRSDTTIEGHGYHTTWLHDQCVEIVKRWKAFVESHHALQKGFISIKGYYYQASVRGEETIWLVPHDFSSKHPKTVEHSVMLSFLEFHVHFLRFVLFKLEEDARAALAARDDEDATFSMAFDDDPSTEHHKTAQGLFRGLVFYVSREAVPEQVTFVARCLGASIATSPKDEGVTHYIIDRPALPMGEQKIEGIEYVQPQYVFDCLNTRILLPVDGYGIGEKCPAHVSPFTVSYRNDNAEFTTAQRVEHRDAFVGDTPERVHEMRRLIDPNYAKGKEGVVGAEEDDDLDSEDYDELDAGKRLDSDSDDDSDEDDSDDEDPEEEGIEVHEDYVRSKKSARAVEKQRALKAANAPTDEAKAEQRRQREKEQAQERANASKQEKIALKKQLTKQQEEERKQGAKSLLTKKVRGIYTAASMSQKRLRDKAESFDNTRTKLKAGEVKVNPRGYLEKH